MPSPLNIAIIGAGIGGLAAAALLKRAGHTVNVYEQAPRFARVGAGIQMAPNAVRVLRALGIDAHVRSFAFESPVALSREWNTGEVTSELKLGHEVEARYGAPYLFLHRADLHRAIAQCVPDDIVHPGVRLIGITQQASSLELAFADGSRVHADLAIGADGVHSLVRETLLGPEQPRFTGRVAYRTTFASDRLRSSITPVRTKWWGPDRHMVVYYVTSALDELYFVTSVPESAEWMTPESWSSKGNLEELRAAYAGFHPEVQAVLAACPEVYKWALLDRDPLPKWWEDNVVLLGDACHPMTPYMAQGAAAALEDAAVLTRCLARIDARDGIAEALALYETTRKPRASAIQTGSSENTWLRGATDPAWVYGYDAWTAPLGGTPARLDH